MPTLKDKGFPLPEKSVWEFYILIPSNNYQQGFDKESRWENDPSQHAEL